MNDTQDNMVVSVIIEKWPFNSKSITSKIQLQILLKEGVCLMLKIIAIDIFWHYGINTTACGL